MYEQRITKAAVARWSVLVPVQADEIREEAANQSHNGSPLTADRLRITNGWNGLNYYLSGVNVRQDGSAGKLNLIRVVSRGYLDESYPKTMTEAKAALTELAGQIATDAGLACQVILALAGE